MSKAKFKGKPQVLARSSDNNPWDYESPGVSAEGRFKREIVDFARRGTPKRPQKNRISAEEKAQEKADEEARAKAADEAAKARQLAAARAKVAAAQVG